MKSTWMKRALLIPAGALLLGLAAPVNADADSWRWNKARAYDRFEDRLDRFEDRIDRREDRRDRRVNLGPRDRIEDRLDRLENRLDRRENRFDRYHGPRASRYSSRIERRVDRRIRKLNRKIRRHRPYIYYRPYRLRRY